MWQYQSGVVCAARCWFVVAPSRSNSSAEQSTAARSSWNGTDGGVINGGVSQKNAERFKIGRICAKLAGFARNVRKSCANLRKFANLLLQSLRKFARNLRPRLLRYRLFLSEPVPQAMRFPAMVRKPHSRIHADLLLLFARRGAGIP